MAKFIYNNPNYVNTSHIVSELNCKYYLCVFFENKTNLCSKSCLAKELAKELRDLMLICQQNLFHTQKISIKIYNKGRKPWIYMPSKKVWLNSKYLKIK